MIAAPRTAGYWARLRAGHPVWQVPRAFPYPADYNFPSRRSPSAGKLQYLYLAGKRSLGLKSHCYLPLPLGSAEGRNRTGTGFPPRDFKSLASTNSATPATFIYNGLQDLFGSLKHCSKCFSKTLLLFLLTFPWESLHL